MFDEILRLVAHKLIFSQRRESLLFKISVGCFSIFCIFSLAGCDTPGLHSGYDFGYALGTRIGERIGERIFGKTSKGQSVPQDYRQTADQKEDDEVTADTYYHWGKALKDGGFAGGGALQVNDRDAVSLFYLAAEQGNPVALSELGHMYATGRGVPKDERMAEQLCHQAFKGLSEAAALGNAAAQFNLGRMYEFGRGVSKDEHLAVYWYREAAEQGDASAQNNLGAMYEQGKSVSQDPYLAEVWYRRAAKQGNVSSQVNLGRMYKDGLGVPQNRRQAMEWFEKAAKQGDSEARKLLNQMRCQ